MALYLMFDPVMVLVKKALFTYSVSNHRLHEFQSSFIFSAKNKKKTDIGKVRTRIIGSTKPILSSHSAVFA